MCVYVCGGGGGWGAFHRLCCALMREPHCVCVCRAGELASTQQYLMGLWVACVVFGMLVYDWHFKFEGRRKVRHPHSPTVMVSAVVA